MKTLSVDLGASSYPIFIGDKLDLTDLITPYIDHRQVMVVTNETVAPLYLESMIAELSAASCVTSCILPDGEAFKSQDTMTQIYDALMQANYNRDCVIIALGGGVVGDMAGFAAASFQRGVDFIQMPTTLLSQVDSSVGGKTGINHALGKNMIGAFKQPKAVFIDTASLATLPAREVSAGIAEIIKYALIADVEFLSWLESNMIPLKSLDASVVADAVYRSCEHKAVIVAQDEFEAGKRALLNLGHTFGHAIENHTGYGVWLHGEAVGFGMLQAAYLSYLQGWLRGNDVERIRQLLIAADLPVVGPDMSAETALALMSRDKKVKSGRIRLVLLKQLGDAMITTAFDDDKLQQTLNNTSCTLVR